MPAASQGERFQSVRLKDHQCLQPVWYRWPHCEEEIGQETSYLRDTKEGDTRRVRGPGTWPDRQNEKPREKLRKRLPILAENPEAELWCADSLKIYGFVKLPIKTPYLFYLHFRSKLFVSRHQFTNVLRLFCITLRLSGRQRSATDWSIHLQSLTKEATSNFF
jgi:hypothetical protein